MVRVGGYGVSWPPYSEAVLSAKAAEEVGFDWVLYSDQTDFSHPQSVWTPEFSSLAAVHPRIDAWYDPAPLIAGCAPHAEKIGLAWGVTDPVRRHPVTLAQGLLTLDHATQGRSIILLASGENKQMKPYGASRKGATDKLLDAVPMMKLLMSTTEPVNYSGRVWTMKDAVLGLQPYGEKPPAIWVAGAGPCINELVGTHADGWFIYVPGSTGDNPEFFRSQVEEIHRHARAAGRDPGEIAIALLMVGVVDTEPAHLDALRRHPFLLWNTLFAVPNSNQYYDWGLSHPYGRGWSYSQHMFPQWIGRPEFEEKIAQIPDDAIDRVNILGSPAQCMQRLQPYIDAGATDIFIYNFGALCGLEYAESSGEGVVQLLHMLKGMDPAKASGSYATVA